MTHILGYISEGILALLWVHRIVYTIASLAFAAGMEFERSLVITWTKGGFKS